VVVTEQGQKATVKDGISGSFEKSSYRASLARKKEKKRREGMPGKGGRGTFFGSPTKTAKAGS